MILIDLPSNILNHILEYNADCSESLMKIDRTCYTLCKSTDNAWNMLAFMKFGLDKNVYENGSTVADGKHIYQSAIAMLRREQPIFVKLEKPLGCQTIHSKSVDDAFFGDFQMAASEHVLVTGSDSMKQNVGWGLPPCSLQVRDARDLSILAQIPCDDSPHRVAILGPEILYRQLNGSSFLRDSLGVEQDVTFDIATTDETADSVGLIANEDFVVVTHDGILTVYYDLSELGKFEQRFRWVIKTGRACELMGLRWAPAIEEDAFCFSTQQGEIFVYGIRLDERNKMHVEEIKQIHTLEDNGFGSLVLSEKYVVGCLSFTNEVIVFTKRGKKLHTLVNTILEDFDTDDGYPYPLAMELFGEHHLVTSSIEGAALCIWDLRNGQLVRKFTQAFDDGLAELRNDYPDITGIVKCQGFDFPAYVMVDYTGDHYLWGFPISDKDTVLLQNISRREEANRHIKSSITVEGIDDELPSSLVEGGEDGSNADEELENEKGGETSEEDFDSGADSEEEEFRIFNMVKLTQMNEGVDFSMTRPISQR